MAVSPVLASCKGLAKCWHVHLLEICFQRVLLFHKLALVMQLLVYVPIFQIIEAKITNEVVLHQVLLLQRAKVVERAERIRTWRAKLVVLRRLNNDRSQTALETWDLHQRFCVPGSGKLLWAKRFALFGTLELVRAELTQLHRQSGLSLSELVVDLLNALLEFV